MLAKSKHDQIKRALQKGLDLLSVPAVWTQAKVPNATKNIQVGFGHTPKNDQELINAYGINSVVITLFGKDFPTNPPEKFDSLVINGKTYILDDVEPRYINAEVVFYKSVVRND